MHKKIITFQNLIFLLQKYWSKKKCTIIQPLDIEIGAGTFHPITFLRTLGKNPIFAAYIQHCRRPSDGRYGKNNNRLQQYYQFQVIIKPSPKNVHKLYFKSLKYIGINLKTNDIQLIEDNWKNQTLGAYGYGWEIRLNGTEITQITYFQKMGNIKCKSITIEITYGLERIAMILQKKDNIYNIVWNNQAIGPSTYGKLFYKNELEQSEYNFKQAKINILLKFFKKYEKQANILLKKKNPLPIPSYEYTLKIIHIFNLLESRKAISNIERQRYIFRISSLTKKILKIYHTLNN